MKLMKNLLAMAAIALCATACSSDDNEVTPNYSESLAGSYPTYSVATVMGTTLANNNEAITITAGADSNSGILAYDGQWGEGSTSQLAINESNGTYTLSGSGTVAASMSGSNNAGNYNFTVEGTINASKELALTFSIELGAMGMVTVEVGSGYAPADSFLPGTYEGYVSAKSAYFEGSVTEGETITITADEGGTLTLAYPSSTWGTSTVSNISVKISDEGVYTLSGTGKSAMGMGTTTNEYDCELSGTVSADKTTVEFAITIPTVMGGTVISFCQGDAPTTTE